MGSVLSKGTLFPPELTNEMFNLVRGKSSLARLSGQRPIPFNGETAWTFNLDSEVDIVAENSRPEDHHSDQSRVWRPRV